MQTDPSKAVSSSEQEYVERVAVRRFNWHPPSRRTALLTRGADPATERGVEFGALNNPIVRPMDGDISFVDYATTESLRAYPHDARIDKAGIVDVNYIWAGSGSLAEVVGGPKCFDYAIASHVIEHVPNVLGWWRGICEVLRPGGVFNLAIPDRRYTFDVRRKPSTLGELVEADLLGFRHPSARQMFDHCHSATAMAPGEPWHSDIDIERLPTMMGPTGLRLAFDQARAIVANGTYFDSHCWIFTPASFLELLRGATELGLVPFILSEFQPTEAGEFEFFATFRRPFAEAGPAMLEEMMEAIDVHRTALSRLADEQEVRQQRVQGEVARWRDEADLQHRRNMTLDHELSAAQARLMTLEGELRQVHLQAEVSHAAEQGAYLHALRAAYLQGEVHLRDAQIGMIRRSTSWRASWPLRVPRQLATVVLRHGPVGTMKHVARLLGYQAGRGRRRLGRSGSDQLTQHAAIAAGAAYTTALVRSASEVVAPRVLILAELSIPQCAKYRVWQRAQALARLGVPFTVIDWHRTAECRSALQTHALAIFYRVPAMPDVIGLLNEARRLNVTTYWEVDDLIFDEAAYLLNRNLDTLDPRLRAEVLAGIPLYSAALLACGRAIASTATLAEAMRAAGVDHVTVIENGLDDETIAFAEASRARRAEADAIGERSGVVIGYGSGSKAHDADFQQAAPAIAALMRARPDVRLRIMGELTLPPEIKAFSARVERLPFTGYASYLDRLAMCDISLVPLEATLFNDAKSNIKYVEAATLGLPSVCSPRSAFRDVVTHGRDGFIADTEAEWLEALTALVDSPTLRRQVGATAHAHVLARYAPDVIARSQVEPLVRDLDRRTRKKLRVLAVNVFYWPQSYGGATIVAEELARRLHQRSDTEVFLFASQDQLTDPPHTFLRYADPTEGGDMPVIGVRMPHGHDAVLNFDNPEMLDRFREVLRAVEPDVVHFHCVQGISASILQACQDGGVPFVVTVHDAWWLCQRQFMVRGDGKYCGQTRIDLRVCEACIPEAMHLRQRFAILQQRLSGAARLLFPSEFHRGLYLANGVKSDRALLNRNGVRLPERARAARAPGPIRFAYVGGNDRVKGIHLIRQAFEALDRDDYELHLVDNTLNLGFSSMHADDWRLSGRLRVVPAYQQNTMDAFFEGVDVLLFPSQWKESFGLAVREALLRDVWVIATDGGGTVEDIVDSVNGTVIPLDDDPKPLLAAVTALLDRQGGFAGYRNPHKDRIVTYDAQAASLHAVLADVLAEARTLA